MKRVLVTGADGFTGRYLVSALASAGDEVHGLVRITPTEPVPGLFAAHEGNLDDPDRLLEVVRQVRPDWVVHLAAIAFVAHDDVQAMYQTNLLGTRNLL